MKPFRLPMHFLSLFLVGILCASWSHAQEANLASAVAKIKPSIVAVGTIQATRNPAFQFSGTGFVVGDGTLIATNSHVVTTTLNTEAKETLAIALPLPNGDATLREVSILVRDQEHDLVLLKISGMTLPKVSLGNSDLIREGQLYGLIGFPLGSVIGLFPATHRATISAISPIVLPQPTSRQLDAKLIEKLRSQPFNIFQLDANSFPGNSGSPLFDPVTGEVVGILNMVFVKNTREASLSQASGIAYAIPVNHLRVLVEKAMNSLNRF